MSSSNATVTVLPLAAVLLVAACHHRLDDEAQHRRLPSLSGPDHAQVPLLRALPGDDKIHIQADLGLESPAIFLVDTGASVSVVSAALAEALELQPQAEQGVLQGLGGTMRWSSVLIPEMKIGDFTLRNILAASDVQGVPAFSSALPLDGILGNNVWSQFVLSVDYPANVLVLDKPGTAQLPESATPMLFDGLHCYAFAAVESGEGEEATAAQLLLALDTGARGVLLAGASGEPFAALATEGEEPVFGIGSGENLPASNFMRRTRRVPISSVSLGGVTVDGPGHAQWVNFDDTTPIGPRSMPGLLGHAVFSDHRAIFDFAGERFALVESQGPAVAEDGHQLLLDQDRERHGHDPVRGLYRARLLAWLEQPEQAAQEAAAYCELHPDDAEAAAFLARLHLFMGQFDQYWSLLSRLKPEDLAGSGELIAAVNGHAAEGRAQRALELADNAVRALPGDSQALVALADAKLALGDPTGARKALLEANRLDESPDGHLLRRARVALQDGDLAAAAAHVRRLLELHPSNGFALWFYRHVADCSQELDMLRSDLESAMARLHPDDRPLDFLLAGYLALGEDEQVQALWSEGMQKDCEPLEDGPSRDNCVAWYGAMADQDLDSALELSLRANQQAPHRSDYLDTLAMVHMRRGELEEAQRAALQALRLNPDDIYLLWQVDRTRE